ncbi:regulator of volume decrease after cellular swelling-domain-containing protein [Globomyces pollinis-pini]|nr:regulator of volume decrease after cellular swelling-domain-containing protein [Globomyces pollinis-pini]KAJ2996630.1 hypothetical protein HDV02_006328 [Globomyces sp. JEL0801]
MPILISNSNIDQTAKLSLKAELQFFPTLDGLKLDSGLGELIIGESFLVWHNNVSFFIINYPSIIIHAIARQTESTKAHIYCQLDSSVFVNSEGTSFEGSEETVLELRLTPQSDSEVDSMFQTLCDCAALFPDPEQEIDDNEWITADNVHEFINRENTAVDLDALIVEDINENGKRPIVDNQFDDANEKALR